MSRDATAICPPGGGSPPAITDYYYPPLNMSSSIGHTAGSCLFTHCSTTRFLNYVPSICKKKKKGLSLALQLNCQERGPPPWPPNWKDWITGGIILRDMRWHSNIDLAPSRDIRIPPPLINNTKESFLYNFNCLKGDSETPFNLRRTVSESELNIASSAPLNSRLRGVF